MDVGRAQQQSHFLNSEWVAWVTELVMWLWQQACESPVHAAKDCEQSEAQQLLNDIGKSVDLLQTPIFYPWPEM